MKYPKILLVLILAVFLASCGKKPEVIYTNGKIYTLDKNNTIVEAIGVKDGKIVALGKTSELLEKFSSAKVVDLKGKTVVPGFNDAEGNLMEFSKQLSFVDLRSATSINDIKRILAERVKTANQGEWIGGFGWDELRLPEKDLARLDYKILDSVAANQYVYLLNALGNTTWVNKKLLDMTKVNKDTPDPENGSIGFTDKNEPTGLFYDDAQELVIKVLPQPSEQQIKDNVTRGINELHKYGITGVQDANITENNLDVYKKMADEKKIPIRLYAMIPGKGPLFDKYMKEGPEVYKDKVSVKCVQLEFDGYFETQDAAMESDYTNDPKRKTPYNDEFDIKEMTKKANENGFQVSVKTIGDRAVKSSLNAIESANKEVKSKVGRTRLEYLEFVQPSDMQRIKQLEIIPSIRPEVTLFDKVFLKDLIASDNGKNLGLWNNLFKLNNIVITGTDFPYHTISPLIQMYYLTTGMSLDTADNKEFNNAPQKLSVLDALKSFTVWSAYASLSEETNGSLEEGKFADMVVLSADILTGDPKALLTTKILMTIMNGEIVYENKSPGAFIIN